MYEEETYEVIRERMLENTNVDLDKREGSTLSDMLSPVAEESAEIHMKLNDIRNIAFVEDSFYEELEKKCAEFGVYRKAGVKATGTVTVTGVAGTFIGNGNKIRCGELYYTILNDVILVDNETNTLYLEADDVGYEYNIPANSTLTLVEKVSGVETLTNSSAFENGVDIETDEELKERFDETRKKPNTSGNIADYEKWAKECSGVAWAKCLDLWNGVGTVKVLIKGADNTQVSATNLQQCKDYIETMRPVMSGTLTVETPSFVELTVTIEIKLNSNYSLDQANDVIKEALNEYIETLANEDVIYVKAQSAVASLDCVDDITEFKLNNTTANVAVTDYKIPILKTLTVTEYEEV